MCSFEEWGERERILSFCEFNTDDFFDTRSDADVAER
jgi:hypothetical protein